MKRDFLVPLFVVGFAVAAYMFLRSPAQDPEPTADVSPILTRDTDPITSPEPDIPSQEAAQKAAEERAEEGEVSASGVYETDDFSITLPSSQTIVRDGTRWYVKDATAEAPLPEFTIEKLAGTAADIIALRFEEAPGVTIESRKTLTVPGGEGVLIEASFPGYDEGASKSFYFFTRGDETYLLTEWENLISVGFADTAKTFTFKE